LMDNQQLEDILTRFPYETKTLDYKGPCPWDAETFLKDLIAMANNDNVGYIVVGIKEDKQDDGPHFQREGISDPEVLRSYDEDKMKDKVPKYVDQEIDFHVFKLEDSKGLKYVVIRVNPSKTPPVFCTQGIGDAKMGNIYVRSGIGRVQSSPIKHYTEMQRFVEVAGAALIQRLGQAGLLCPHMAAAGPAREGDLDKFRKQRKDL
jgi:predicted HTH transcriptional regulator